MVGPPKGIEKQDSECEIMAGENAKIVSTDEADIPDVSFFLLYTNSPIFTPILPAVRSWCLGRDEASRATRPSPSGTGSSS